MLLDEVIRNLYLSKYSIVVMMKLHMLCVEAKVVCLNFQGPKHS